MKNKQINYLFQAFNSMAYGFFGTLIIGIILEELGRNLGIDALVTYGSMVKYLMGPAIGVAIAYTRKATGLTLIGGVIAGTIGAGTLTGLTLHIGDPIGALITSMVAIEGAMMIEKKTSFDIFLIPLVVIVLSILTSMFVAPFFIVITKTVGQIVNQATTYQPFLMGIVIAVVMGMALTAPISSAAIAIALGLSGLAAGAAAIGCAAQMIGFAVMTKQDNPWSKVIAVGLGTSMLQFGNILKSPVIWLPPILTSAILGPVSTLVFMLETNAYGAGMGTSGLVGPLTTYRTMGPGYGIIVVLMFFVFPWLLNLLFFKGMVQLKWIKKGSLKIDNMA